jgi:hypothetical protein
MLFFGCGRNPSWDQFDAFAAPARRRRRAFQGARPHRRRNAATAADYAETCSIAGLVAQRGPIMSRTLSFLAILAVGTALGAPLRAQEATQETPQETPQQAPRTSQAAPQPPPQPQEQPAQPPEFGDPRFAFHRIDDAFLRLDLRTGAVASCSQHAAGWACVLVPEERAALDGEIARLQRDNAILKNALLERGVPLPNGMKAEAPPAPSPPAVAPLPPPVESVPRPPQSVPPVAAAPPVSPPKSAESDRASRDDAEIERIMTVMEKVWRRLVEMMMSVQRDMQKKG